MRPLRNSLAALVTIALTGTAYAAPPAEHQQDSDDDYGRAHIGGSQGPIHWESMLHGDTLEGWEASDSLYSTSCPGGVGLATWGKKTIARFRDPKIRHYYKY